MPVKRIIKGFIYLFPLIVVCVTALGSCLFRLNENYSQLIKETTGGTTTTYQYSGSFTNDSDSPIRNGMYQFTELMGYDVDSDLIDVVSGVIEHFGLVENEGTFYYFVRDFIVYEFIALLLNVVLDVLFIVPELFYKFEDESFMSRRKKRR